MRNISRFPITKTMIQVICGLMIIIMLNGCTITGRLPAKTPKAIFISVDGIPADVLEKTDTPHMDDIAGDNGYSRSFVGGDVGAHSEPPPVSAPGYNNLITGTWANKHNVYDNDVEDPNYRYWDIFRIAKTHDASLNTAIFSTWLENRTRLVGDVS